MLGHSIEAPQALPSHMVALMRTTHVFKEAKGIFPPYRSVIARYPKALTRIRRLIIFRMLNLLRRIDCLSL